MSLVDVLENNLSSQIYGVVIGIVTNNKDPEAFGRVKLKFPWLNEEDESNWARVSVLMAGKKRGTFFLPEVDDEVLVAFEQGNLNRPFVLGALWNGKDKPPETNSNGKNDIRLIESRSGHQVKFDDTDGKEKIIIVDKSGENQIEFDTAKNAINIIAGESIKISSGKDITISAPDGTLKIEAKEIISKSSTKTQLKASEVNFEASGNMKIKGAMVNIN